MKVLNHCLQLLQFLNTEFVLVEEPDSARGEVIPGARLGDVLPVCTSGTAGDQSFLLDSDHFEWVTVPPFPSVFASYRQNSKLIKDYTIFLL